MQHVMFSAHLTGGLGCLPMSYRANKPFGRRKTDLSSSARENSHWQQIRRDVEEDSSGLIRRYLRLSEKLVGTENEVKVSEEENASDQKPRQDDSRMKELRGVSQERDRKDRAA